MNKHLENNNNIQISKTLAEVNDLATSINMDSSKDEISEALTLVESYLSQIKQIEQSLKDVAASWIDLHGEFDIGAIHYYVGYSTVIRCRDVLQTGHIALESCGGDIDRLISLLVAQPFKPAATRELIGQQSYGQMFRMIQTKHLENGVPKRILKRAEERFISRQSCNPGEETL